MSCFWIGISLKLSKDDFNFINEKKPISLINFISLLKRKNTNDLKIKWNNKSISSQIMNENYNAIKNYKNTFNNIHRGYDCSAMDPFLVLCYVGSILICWFHVCAILVSRWFHVGSMLVLCVGSILIFLFHL